MTKIFIDAGHGGKDPGAVGQGLQEKDLTLIISKKVGDLLKKHDLDIYYSRTTDIFLDLTTRANKANNINADIFISFHINSATNAAARGFEIWTTRGKTESDDIAEVVALQFMKDFPSVPFRSDKSDGDLDKESNFTVITKSKMPAILLELGFIVNAQDAQMLRTQQDKIANTIANGILNYLKITPNSGIKLNIKGIDITANGYFKNNTNYIKIGKHDVTVRELAEALNLKDVSWDNKNQIVIMK